MQLKDKVAIINGSARGLKGICFRFEREGAKVTV